MENRPVPEVDILMYAGKWYSILSIPRFFNKHWRNTTETYVIHPDGYYAVFSTYRVVHEDETKYFRSKLSAIRGTKNTQFKLQTFWPFKDEYWVIELAEDYSYAVVGHPELKSLNIMSRKPEIDETLLSEIIMRCRQKGYDTSQLVAQEHQPSARETDSLMFLA